MDSELMAVRAALAERDKTIAELREHVCTLDLEAKDNNTLIAGLVELVKELHGELDFYAVETYTPNSTVRAIESRPEVKAALEGK